MWVTFRPPVKSPLGTDTSWGTYAHCTTLDYTTLQSHSYYSVLHSSLFPFISSFTDIIFLFFYISLNLLFLSLHLIFQHILFYDTIWSNIFHSLYFSHSFILSSSSFPSPPSFFFTFSFILFSSSFPSLLRLFSPSLHFLLHFVFFFLLYRYELYDLVALHNNEAAVVVAVGTEKLAVVNLSDERKELLPPELQGSVK